MARGVRMPRAATVGWPRILCDDALLIDRQAARMSHVVRLDLAPVRHVIKSVRKQAAEMPGPETRALFREAKRLKGSITDEESVPVAFFNYERRHSWERAI